MYSFFQIPIYTYVNITLVPFSKFILKVNVHISPCSVLNSNVSHFKNMSNLFTHLFTPHFEAHLQAAEESIPECQQP